MSTHVNFEPSFHDQVIACPVCGGPNLHQEYLHTADPTDEIRIGFTCEGWCPLPDLVIRQHKGLTLLEWSDKRAGETHVECKK